MKNPEITEQIKNLIEQHGITALLWAVHDAVDDLARQAPKLEAGFDVMEIQLAALAEFAQEKENK
jgi:hypothetical protein